MIAHLNHLGRGYDIELLGRTIVFFQQLKDALFITKEDHAALLIDSIECHYGTFDCHLGGKIATHRVNTDFYHSVWYSFQKRKKSRRACRGTDSS